jgi:hypothetical protein
MHFYFPKISTSRPAPPPGTWRWATYEPAPTLSLAFLWRGSGGGDTYDDRVLATRARRTL